MNNVILLETLLKTPKESHEYSKLYTEVLKRITYEETVQSIESESSVKVMSMRRVQEMSNAYKDYINLLGEEIDELAKLAYIHGWESKRAKEGTKLREGIEYFEKLIQ